MQIKIHKPFQSPNTDFQVIRVEFLILHYTACSLERCLSLFKDPLQKISCHFVINLDGSIYEIVPCLQGKPLKAFHAGQSSWTNSGKNQLKNFNNISLGIELVNNNGNYFPYTEVQYRSLIYLTRRLKSIYPEIRSPDRILGHEHIAGFRGKIDPGYFFDWKKYFKAVYPTTNKSSLYPKRKAVLPEELRERFNTLIKSLPESEKTWETLNTMLEKQYKHYLDTI